MRGITQRRSGKAGLPPGSPVYVGESREAKVRITLLDFDQFEFRVLEQLTTEQCVSFKESPTVTWLNVDGLHEVEVIERIGRGFGLHPLIIEDILNTEQRPKINIFDDYIFLVARMHTYDHQARMIDVEQISLILGKHFVLTFQEKPGDIFDPIRKRIRENLGRIRKEGPDYLAYTLLDAIVDSYFNVLEAFGDDLENLEDEVVSEPLPQTVHRIHFLKRELAYLRKSVWPLREIVAAMKRDETSLIRKSTAIFLGDLYDHTIQVIDTVETYRDIVSGMIDIYLSSISNRMNEIMKVLTIFAAIFIPLTFVAGIYGMNFNTVSSPFNMPELNWYYGYPVVLCLMLCIGVALLLFFKKKGWL